MSADDVSIVIDGLVRRLRLVRVLEVLVRAAFAAAVLLCLGLVWDKFQPLSLTAWQALLAGAGVVVLAGTVGAWVRPVSRLAAAKRADVRLDLEDRLSSACEFMRLAHPTRLMRAHITETSAHLDRVAPHEAVPFRPPRGLPLLSVAVVVMCLLVLLPGFAVRVPAAPRPQAALLPPLRFPGERTVDSLIAALDLERDRPLAELMRQLKQLYADVRAGQLSREEALGRVGEAEARLSDVERQRARGATAHTWRHELERALAQKGSMLAGNPVTAELGRSMAELKLDEASRESRSLAAAASATPPTLELTPEQSRALAELLSQAARKDQRTLDVLSSHMDEAARKLSLEDMKAFVKSIEETARELERLKAEMEKLKALARTGEELEELKEMVSALRQDGTGRWVFGETASDARAMGYLKLQGVEPPKGDKDDAEPGVGDTPEGPGTGGEATRIETERTPRDLPGIWGDGPGLIEIVQGAAAEGVAAAAYRDVADQAARLAEDAVHTEDIPLGYRFYIKRYFQLIRPPIEAPKETP